MRYLTGVFILLIIVSISFAQVEFKQGDVVYIKTATENLRLSPNGTMLTTLPQATKLTVIGQQGSWVAVQLVAWIWAPSLTDDKTKISGFTMRALHILVKTETEANEIKALLVKGADFQQLAKERSLDPNAPKGGDLGVINKGDLLPELDAALLKLKAGETSNVIKSEVGFHLLKRLE